tara:strand:- start:52 stop:351 length:300 start_codon:yes stop_codon:yes gene_type:complete
VRFVAILLFGLILAELKYNPYTHNFENCSKESTLTYNVYTNSYSYEDLGSGYKYNPYEKKFDIANDKDVLKYNHITNTWDYTSKNSKLIYKNNNWYFVE